MKGEVCAKDLLPEKKVLDIKVYIVNTDIAIDLGEHWVAIYFRRDQVIFSDSYGRPPEEQYVLPFLKETLQDGSITQNVYRVYGVKYVECSVSTSFTSSTKDYI